MGKRLRRNGNFTAPVMGPNFLGTERRIPAPLPLPSPHMKYLFQPMTGSLSSIKVSRWIPAVASPFKFDKESCHGYLEQTFQ